MSVLGALAPGPEEVMGSRTESTDVALGREWASVSADQSGEDRREHGAREDRIMVHVIRNEMTVAHANEGVHHGEADRPRRDLRGDTVSTQRGRRSPGAVADVVHGSARSLRPRSFSHDRGENHAE